MSKVIAIFDIDEEKLEEVESGSVESAFGWLEDSGLYLNDYEKLEEKDINLRGSLKTEKEIREKAIHEFAERLHDLCGMEFGGFQYSDVLHESRIDEIAEELKRDTVKQTQVSPTL